MLTKYGLSHKKLILTVSRLSKADQYKGHRRVIKALPALRELHPDVAYVVLGDGDGREELENLASELQLKPHVRFFGRVSDEDVLALYRSASVYNAEYEGRFWHRICRSSCHRPSGYRGQPRR